MTPTPWPIGVFTSIDAGLGVHWQVVHELKIPTIQLHAPAKATRTVAHAEKFMSQLDQMGVQLTCVFGGFSGESYADIPTVARTVGLVPPATRTPRLAEMKEIAAFARQLECSVAALHLGFVPHEVQSTDYRDVVAATQDLCRFCRGLGQNLHLETGQESATALLQFIDDVGADNLFVNFDPANMILYGTGQPIEALLQIGSRVRSVHCKDATWAARPGMEWGREVALGKGDVDFDRFLRALLQIGYEGPLTIEREIPQDPLRQKSEIAHAVGLLESLREKILNTASK
jgi:sugar phosphate isomerase/epimerase